MENQTRNISTVDMSLNKFFLRIYGWMTIGLLTTALVAFLISRNEVLFNLYVNFLSSTGRLGLLGIGVVQLLLVLTMRPDMEKLANPTGYIVKFIIYSAITGITLTTYLLVFELSSVMEMFVSTAAIFAGLSIVGFVTKKDLTGIGQQALGALIGVIIASLVNVFIFRSDMASMIMSGITVIIFIILTMYDTQKLKMMYYQLEGTPELGGLAIIGALELYLDFINLFFSLLRLFGRRR